MEPEPAEEPGAGAGGSRRLPALCWALRGAGEQGSRAPGLWGGLWPLFSGPPGTFHPPPQSLVSAPAGALVRADGRSLAGLSAASPDPAGAAPIVARAAPVAWDPRHGDSGVGSSGRGGAGCLGWQSGASR